MKFISCTISILSLSFILTSCNSGEVSSTTDEEISAPTELDGVFALNNDTLKITSNSDNFGKNIEFDLTANRDETIKMIFNQAPLVEQSSTMEHYRLKNWITGDSSYVAYELLDFTFDFNENQWTIKDTIVITDQSASLGKFINLGGIYNRVK